MSDLRINYGETMNVGNQVSSKGEEFQTLLNKIKATNSELKTYWEGSDSQKYASSVEEQAQVMQKLCDTINEMGEFLVKAGTAYRDAMESNSNAIK
mgnify:CR=1 FL=1